MEWGVITAILGVVSGGTGLLFFSERKRSEQLKNEKSAATEWQKLFLQRDQDVRERDVKIDSLYGEIGLLRDEKNEHTTKLAILDTQKCLVNGCTHRQPPRGF